MWDGVQTHSCSSLNCLCLGPPEIPRREGRGTCNRTVLQLKPQPSWAGGVRPSYLLSLFLKELGWVLHDLLENVLWGSCLRKGGRSVWLKGAQSGVKSRGSPGAQSFESPTFDLLLQKVIKGPKT